MYTYDDLIKVGNDEAKRIEFIETAIADYESSENYKTSVNAGIYYRGGDPILEKVEKIIYDLKGMAHKNIFAPNHKIYTDYLKFFTIQTVEYMLGNGISFDNAEIKKKLGNKFDYQLKKALRRAILEGVSYSYAREDGIDAMSGGSSDKDPVFFPLKDEFSGVVKGGVKYWQIADDKPKYAILYETDGYTVYKAESDEGYKATGRKHYYREKITTFPETNEPDIIENVAEFSDAPIIPLEYIEKDSCIKYNWNLLSAFNALASKLVNNSDEADLIYWVLKNAGGMDEIDDQNFIINLIKSHVLHLEDGVEAEPHKLEASPEKIIIVLDYLRVLLFFNFMAVDTKSIRSGNVTTVEIDAAFENLELKCSQLEESIDKFIRNVLAIYGFDENEPYHLTYNKATNQAERVQSFLSAAQYFDSETVIRKLCELFGMIDNADDIVNKVQTEQMALIEAQAGSDEE